MPHSRYGGPGPHYAHWLFSSPLLFILSFLGTECEILRFAGPKGLVMIKSDLANIKRDAYCMRKSKTGNSSAAHSPCYHQHLYSVRQQQPFQHPTSLAGTYSCAVTGGQLINLMCFVEFFSPLRELYYHLYRKPKTS